MPDMAIENVTGGADTLTPADGPDPGLLPGDREDAPMAMDEFGTTAEEQLRGESLEQRLSREQPDTEPEPVPIGMLDDGPIDPHADSEVSTMETLGEDPITHGEVGRLVQPDEGGGTAYERDSIAYDAGTAGGGPGAEEAAMHEVRPEE
jgi:hypothetical protein